MRGRVLARVLFDTSRPAQLLLIAGVYLLGVTIAHASGAPLAVERITVGGFPLLAVAASVHYVNEYADYETDTLTDRTPFSGGSGALQETGTPRRVALYAAVGALAVGFVSLLVLFGTGALSPAAVSLLAVIAVLGWAYSLEPVRLIRRGLGEFTNVALGGLVLPVYGAAVVGGPPGEVALACVPFSFVVMLNLFATHWPDREADAAAGKRTLVVRWSSARVERAYSAVAVGALLSLLVLSQVVLPVVVVGVSLLVAPLVVLGRRRVTSPQVPWPSVGAMVGLTTLQFAGWWVVI